MKGNLQIEKWGKWNIIWVDSENTVLAIDALNGQGVDGVGISLYKGYKLDNIEFIRNNEVLADKGVVLPFGKDIDISALSDVKTLKFLTVIGNREFRNFSEYIELEDLRVECHLGTVLPNANSNLEMLYLQNYKPKCRNLTSLNCYPNLIDLEINQGNILDMDGIKKLSALRKLSLFNIRSMQNIDAIVESEISHVHIDGSKNIQNIELFAESKNIKTLRLINCGKIKSLDFIKRFHSLEELRFVKTYIEDGDMTPLFGLKSVGFLKEKGYSHTPEQVIEMLH